MEESRGFQEEPLALEVAREFAKRHVHKRVRTPAVIVQNASLAAPEFGGGASSDRAGSRRDEDLCPLLACAFDRRGCCGREEVDARDSVDDWR